MAHPRHRHTFGYGRAVSSRYRFAVCLEMLFRSANVRPCMFCGADSTGYVRYARMSRERFRFSPFHLRGSRSAPLCGVSDSLSPLHAPKGRASESLLAVWLFRVISRPDAIPSVLHIWRLVKSPPPPPHDTGGYAGGTISPIALTGKQVYTRGMRTKPYRGY